MTLERKVLVLSILVSASLMTIISVSPVPKLATNENSVVQINLSADVDVQHSQIESLMLKKDRRPKVLNDLFEKRLEQQLAVSQSELAHRLDSLEIEKRININKMKDKGIKIPKVLTLSIRDRVAIAHYLELTPSTLNTNDLRSARLTTTEWIKIKDFANSNDFKILLMRDQLNSQTIKSLAFQN